MEPFDDAARQVGNGRTGVTLDGFAAFYAAHRTQVHASVVLTLGDHQLAAEAVDEAFTRAAERWEQVSNCDRPAGWVYRVAINWATSWRRKWSLRPTRPAELLDRPHTDDLPDVDLVDLLAHLALRERQMLMLRFALGYSVAETAATLGVTEGTVKSASHRARHRLRQIAEASDGHR